MISIDILCSYGPRIDIFRGDGLKKDCIILFHDSSVIFKSINIIKILLNKKKFKFKLVKFKNSEITGLFFGKFFSFNLKKYNLKTESFDKFCEIAAERLLLEQVNNRVKINFKVSKFLKNKYPYKISLKKKEKKRVIV